MQTSIEKQRINEFFMKLRPCLVSLSPRNGLRLAKPGLRCGARPLVCNYQSYAVHRPVRGPTCSGTTKDQKQHPDLKRHYHPSRLSASWATQTQQSPHTASSVPSLHRARVQAHHAKDQSSSRVCLYHRAGAHHASASTRSSSLSSDSVSSSASAKQESVAAIAT